MTDLKLVSTDDLISELLERYESAIFCGVKTNYQKKDDLMIRRNYVGNEIVCMGLCEHVNQAIHLVLINRLRAIQEP